MLTALESARHPYDPSLIGPARHGRGYPGELAMVLTISAAEIVVLTLVLGPRSYKRSWRRVLTALALLTPWTAFWLTLTFGGGPATGMHAVLLLALWLGLAVSAVVSSVGAYRANQREPLRGLTRP